MVPGSKILTLTLYGLTVQGPHIEGGATGAEHPPVPCLEKKK